ncbi:type II toxin-antitoxin system RelE/ParE family toxin [Mycobacterium intracellulare]|nr:MULTISPECIES: type II toxin-antitoxin system RelE/ParE family toxin [Mycobacterium]AFJ35849.1 hypothetical protein W7S_14420 [Mycobacterium sp. MOTT36Y]MCV7407475.1 type II toxin-antitoxin system RelE/ParE family toxin [Mycobacterium marseillense]QXD04133.1 type II toxin-antitoxin system RelE/ParE family toxin [Mycobacterium avium subsp. hominissuis]WVL50391.1 type II toxin-antitoxin system RelE/ParE family toxin [Mycobacterium paraintracellulare]
MSPATQSALEQIWDYTRNRWSANQAETYVREIQ